MFKLYTKVKLLFAVYRYLKDPNQVDSVLKLGNQLLSQQSLSDYPQRYLRNKEIAEMVQQKQGTKKIEFEQLATCHEDSLGWAYYHFIKTNNLDFTFYEKDTKDPIKSDRDYIVYRIRQTHDLWHLVTGFDTSQEGEAGLIAFYYAQLKSPLSALIVGLAIIHFLLKRPKDLPVLFDKITHGWTMGKNSLSLLAYPWEENWNTNLNSIRIKHHIHL
ncbi:MAG: hypothetical protein JNL11_05580 [Bdellovibrionaceae bacterium]|nr:hypothetical protein [Pseudobdellovibrionaceae bacterium]